MTAVLSPTPYLPLAGGTINGSLTIARHIHGGGNPPAVVTAGGAGTSPPLPVVTTGSTDLGGTVSWGTGTVPNTQPQLSVTFAAPWTIPGGGGPHVVVTPLNAATATLELFITGISPTGFQVNVVTAPAASQANTTYAFCYSVMG